MPEYKLPEPALVASIFEAVRRTKSALKPMPCLSALRDWALALLKRYFIKQRAVWWCLTPSEFVSAWLGAGLGCEYHRIFLHLMTNSRRVLNSKSYSIWAVRLNTGTISCSLANLGGPLSCLRTLSCGRNKLVMENWSSKNVEKALAGLSPDSVF